MAFEKRKGEPPIPDNFIDYLNELQQAGLSKIESFGWSLLFIRRPISQDPTIIVGSFDGSTVGVLEDDGRLNLQPDITLR